MKKRMSILLAAVLCLALTGCGVTPPERAADGSNWDLGWVTLGSALGVDAPEGWTLRETDQSRANEGLLYAMWSMGEEESQIDEDGEETVLYDIELQVLLIGAPSPTSAADTIEEWMSLANTHLAVDSTAEQTCNGQPYTVLTYAYGDQENPYDRGAAAYGVYHNYAINVELSCRENVSEDAAALLVEFLERCHYGR